RFGACYKQPLKPSGSEPSAEECRMTPRHAGCDVTEMQRILSQPTFTEHLLRAIDSFRRHLVFRLATLLTPQPFV
ncbi:HHLA3 isoform 6, partial [Pan troglodytes]